MPSQRWLNRLKLNARVRAVFDAWPVRYREEEIAGAPNDSTDFIVGDTETRFIVRVLYPDESPTEDRPEAVRTCSVDEVIRLCLKYLDH